MEAQHIHIIENYINSYNRFDVHGMLEDLHDDVVFENIVNKEVGMRLEGRDAFQKQSELTCEYFSERQQKVLKWQADEDKVTILIDYKATLARDFPNGAKAGDELKLKGKSVFRFEGDKIIKIQDHS